MAAAAADEAAAPAADDTAGSGNKKALVDRIVAVIEQASAKGVSKHKIVKFLKNQNEITQEDINHGYQRYYEKHYLYEITFNEDKMGFSVIMDPHGKNAIVSSIQNEDNKKVGLKIASRIVEIHGTNVEGWQHRKILDKIQQQKTRPFFIVFREPEQDASLQSLKKKEEAMHKFLTEDEIDEIAQIKKTGNDDEDYYSDDVDSDEDYDDEKEDEDEAIDENADVAAVRKHQERKMMAKNKNLITVATMNDVTWQDDEVAEMEARLKEMMEAQNFVDQNAANALTHKRRETLMNLMESQSEDSQSGHPSMANNRSGSSLSVSSTGGHFSQYSDDARIHAHRVSIMNQLATEHPDWTVEQIRQTANSMQETQRQNSVFLMEQTKGATSTAAFIQSVPRQSVMSNGMMKPVTPSTRAMISMWNQPPVKPQRSASFYGATGPLTPGQQPTKRFLEEMVNGCVMLKKTTGGKLVPRWVELTPDYKFLRWYSPKKGKGLSKTAVNLATIQKIHVGKQADTEKLNLKNTSTAFSLEYVKMDAKDGEPPTKLTFIARSQRQAFLWFQAIKICGDVSKRGNVMDVAAAQDKLENLVNQKSPDAQAIDSTMNIKPPTESELEKMIKRANDLYKKIIPLVVENPKRGIVLKSLRKKYPSEPQQGTPEYVEYQNVKNMLEGMRKTLGDRHKQLNEIKDKLDGMQLDGVKPEEMTQMRLDLMGLINEFVSLKVKLVAHARRFQTSLI